MTDVGFGLALTTLAGASTLIGGLIFTLLKRVDGRSLSFAMGISAGAMLFVSLVELLPLSTKDIGFGPACIFFFLGMATIALIDFLLPHDYIGEKVGSEQSRRLMSVGLLAAIGIGIHNFPEGISVFLATLGDRNLGLTLALAVAAHNIPEGIAVAAPIYAATKNRLLAWRYVFLSGVAEPIGAIFALVILGRFVNESVMGAIYGLIAGIMVFISFDELLPCCFENRRGHSAIGGIIGGMGLMALSLYLLG